MRTTAQGIKSIFQRPDLGLLIIRAALAVVLIIAGWNKFQGGEATLNAVGANIKYMGIEPGTNNVVTFFFGIMAAGAELVGGLLLLIGFLFRSASVPLIVTMLVATLYKFQTSGGDFTQYGYPLVVLLVLVGLLFTGPGKYCLQKD
jgi:putative oxidoreductase